jgi:hypothetical protein
MYRKMKVYKWWDMPEHIQQEIVGEYGDLVRTQRYMFHTPYETANWQEFTDESVTEKIASQTLTHYVLRGDCPLSDWLMDNGTILQEEVLIII